MQVTPKTEKEIYEANLLPNGWYPFTIGKAEEKTSKKGNEMIELNVKVYKEDSGFIFVRDFLMNTEFGAFKLRHCADTCGLLDSYNAGTLDASDMENREGYAKIGVEKSKDDQFPDKNKIMDYAKQPPAKKGEGAKEEVEDDVPF